MKYTILVYLWYFVCSGILILQKLVFFEKAWHVCVFWFKNQYFFLFFRFFMVFYQVISFVNEL